ncbi:TetR family transcriptional regulator [Candidatus Leptofilum sp.]|uniref:TetR family transcriptional regulator n=1 Tax=Candidatus Leptofilum sp. TaxID=3241576 RepID=UPI003B5CEFC4
MSERKQGRYERLSTSAIARRAGISIGSLHQFFAKKNSHRKKERFCVALLPSVPLKNSEIL